MTIPLQLLSLFLILALLSVLVLPAAQTRFFIDPEEISCLATPHYVPEFAMIQTLQAAMRMGLCSPKVLYGPCAFNTAIFACRITKHSRTWGVLVLKIPTSGDTYIDEGRYMVEEEFISMATTAPYYCPVQPIVFP